MFDTLISGVCELHNQHFASTKQSNINKHFNKYHKVNHYSEYKQNAHLEATYLSNIEQSEINDQLNIDSHMVPSARYHIQKYKLLFPYVNTEIIL